MITIKDIAVELENILNGASGNIPSSAVRPFDGLFAVRTEGYHLDNVHDFEEGRNFFPVFIGTVNGEYNPIPELEQTDFDFPISIYFPVRFKDQMLAMQQYLVDVFVGRAIGFGENNSQYGVCNISLGQLGEITELDLDQFGNSILKGLNEYIQEQYKMPVQSNEPWICLTFNLYISTMKNALSDKEGSFLFGNMFDIALTYSGYTETIITDGIDISYEAQTESQQAFRLGSGSTETESTSLVVSNAVSYTMTATVRRNSFWHVLMNSFLYGEIGGKSDFQLSITLKNKFSGTEFDFQMKDRDVVLTSFTTKIGANETLCATMTFTPRAVVQ